MVMMFSSMVDYVRQVMHPVWYHGHERAAPFFEGWYYKCVSADGEQKWSFIPGIFIHQDPTQSHAFVQVLNGTDGVAHYHRFVQDDFEARRQAFDVRIGASHFQLDTITLDIDDASGRIKGTLRFQQQQPWRITPFAPGVMGPFAWIPFLECYHGICSLDHSIVGSLEINGDTVDFTGGRGYIEKDWGQSFPSGYIWQQSNHFDTKGTSLTASFASIPNLGRTFAGFIVGLWHDGQLYPFTTYNGSRVEYLYVDDQAVRWALSNRRYRLDVVVSRSDGAALRGPQRENMHMRVDETLNSVMDVRLINRQQRIIVEGRGQHAALEVVGDLSLLLEDTMS